MSMYYSILFQYNLFEILGEMSCVIVLRMPKYIKEEIMIIYHFEIVEYLNEKDMEE